MDGRLRVSRFGFRVQGLGEMVGQRALLMDESSASSKRGGIVIFMMLSNPPWKMYGDPEALNHPKP